MSIGSWNTSLFRSSLLVHGALDSRRLRCRALETRPDDTPSRLGNSCQCALQRSAQCCRGSHISTDMLRTVSLSCIVAVWASRRQFLRQSLNAVGPSAMQRASHAVSHSFVARNSEPTGVGTASLSHAGRPDTAPSQIHFSIGAAA